MDSSVIVIAVVAVAVTVIVIHGGRRHRRQGNHESGRSSGTVRGTFHGLESTSSIDSGFFFGGKYLLHIPYPWNWIWSIESREIHVQTINQPLLAAGRGIVFCYQDGAGTQACSCPLESQSHVKQAIHTAICSNVPTLDIVQNELSYPHALHQRSTDADVSDDVSLGNVDDFAFLEGCSDDGGSVDHHNLDTPGRTS
jgi:hypothetical protein